MTIGLWQVPVLVGAGIVMVTYLVSWIGGARRSPERPPNPGRTAVAKTAGLAVLSVALFGLLVRAVQELGTSVAVNIAAVASLVLEGAALRLTYLSYRATKEISQAPAQPLAPAQPAPAQPPGPAQPPVPAQQEASPPSEGDAGRPAGPPG